jgi:hypothetical protein
MGKKEQLCIVLTKWCVNMFPPLVSSNSSYILKKCVDHYKWCSCHRKKTLYYVGFLNYYKNTVLCWIPIFPHSWFIIGFVTNYINTTGATSGARTADPSETPEFTPGFEWGLCYSIFSFKHTINKGNNKITELRTILQRESQNS